MKKMQTPRIPAPFSHPITDSARFTHHRPTRQPAALLLTLAVVVFTALPNTAQTTNDEKPLTSYQKKVFDFVQKSSSHAIDIQFRHPTSLPVELRAVIRSREVTRFSMALSHSILAEKTGEYARFLVQQSGSQTVLLFPRDVFEPSCWEKIQTTPAVKLPAELIRDAGLPIPEYNPITLTLPFDRRIKDASGRTIDVTLLSKTDTSIKFRLRDQEFDRPLASLSPDDQILIQHTKNPDIAPNGIRVLTLPFSGAYAKPLRELGFDVTRLSLTESDGADSDTLKYIKDMDAYVSGFDAVWGQQDGEVGYKQTGASQENLKKIQNLVDMAKKQQRAVVICHGPYKTHIVRDEKDLPRERFNIRNDGDTIECKLSDAYRRPDENSLRVSEHPEKLGAILLKRGRHK